MSEASRPAVASVELYEAITDYLQRANASARVARTLSHWTCLIHVEATDTDDRFTVHVERGTGIGPELGQVGVPDLVVRGLSADLADVFWGEVNPASGYLQGAISTQGHQDDVMRLDAMAMYIFLGQ